MKKIVTFMFLLTVLTTTTNARIIIVDINGGGQFTSISAAISAAVANDTVKVWPGTYLEQVNLNKNIKLLGSGYEGTVITGNFSPTVSVSSGSIQWFKISSTTANGVHISGGVISNCVITSCSGEGIQCVSGTTSLVMNCMVTKNASFGIHSINGSTLSVTNTISLWNGNTGFRGWEGGLSLSFSNGSRNNTAGNQGCIEQDPLFASPTDYHLSEGSPCWNTGNESYLDPDGSRSDMGYFGGTNCPIYPTVFEIIIDPVGNNINLRAKARANY